MQTYRTRATAMRGALRAKFEDFTIEETGDGTFYVAASSPISRLASDTSPLAGELNAASDETVTTEDVAEQTEVEEQAEVEELAEIADAEIADAELPDTSDQDEPVATVQQPETAKPRETSSIENPVAVVWATLYRYPKADKKVLKAALVAAGVHKGTVNTQSFHYSKATPAARKARAEKGVAISI